MRRAHPGKNITGLTVQAIVSPADAVQAIVSPADAVQAIVFPEARCGGRARVKTSIRHAVQAIVSPADAMHMFC